MDKNKKNTKPDTKSEETVFEDKVLQIKRVSKKTKGGNSLAFTALVAVGNKQGRLGVGLAKAKDVRSAIDKAIVKANKNQVDITLAGNTIPHGFTWKKGAARLILKPAPAGSGVMVGGALRPLVELAGIRDISIRIVGTRNKLATVYAAMEAFQNMTAIERSEK